MLVSDIIRLEITIASHYFKVTVLDQRLLYLLQIFKSRYTDMQNDKAATVFWLDMNNIGVGIIGQWSAFKDHLLGEGIHDGFIKYTHLPMYQPLSTPSVTLKPNWVLKSYQQEISDFLLSGDTSSKLTLLQTGKGKTVTALATVVKYRERVAIVVLAGYVDKWVEDVEKTLDRVRLRTIVGSKDLTAVITEARSGELSDDYFIISMQTLTSFYRKYEEYKTVSTEYGYDIWPYQLFETLGIGTVVIDEVHQHLGRVHKVMSYMHVPRLLALSATFMSNNRLVSKVQNLMFPDRTRIDMSIMTQYVNITAIAYKSPILNKLRTSHPRTSTYSHTAFEKSILSQPKVYSSYFELVDGVIKVTYIDPYLPNDKLLIFAASVMMCKRLAADIRKRYPGRSVSTFVEGDPYSNLLESEICVSTIGSAGTAHDIAGLRVVILTVAIDSPVSNLQAIGRLRELPDRDVKFIYMFCEQIPKHKAYHRSKTQLLRGRVASYKEFWHPKILST
jgi:hypothetical protein